MQRNLYLSLFYAMITILLWSVTYVFTKLAMDYYSSSSLALLRCAVASVCLGGVLVVRKSPLPPLSSLPRFLLSGATGFAVYLIVFNMASKMLNPTTSCVIISTTPIITALLALLLFGEKLGVIRWLAIGMAFCGILVMALWNGVLHLSTGTLWMLLAAALLSMYNILQRFLSKTIDPLAVAAYSFFAGTVMLLPFVPETVEQVRHASAANIWLAIFLGALPSAVANLFWAKAFALAPTTSTVSNTMFLTPFLALVFEYVVTAGLPGAETFVGGGIIMASLLVFVWASRKG